jgi:ABC-type lipoprotein release transport system permease subunit
VYRLFLALRYLRSRLVNLISVGGVAAGVAVLLVVTSVMDGFQEKVREVLRGNLSDLIMVPTVEEVPPYAAFDLRLREESGGAVIATSPQRSALLFYPYISLRRNEWRAGDRALFLLTAVGIDWERERDVSSIAKTIVAAERPSDPFFAQRAVEFDNADTVIVSRTFAEKFKGLGTQFLTPAALLASEEHSYLDVLAVDIEEEEGPEAPSNGGRPRGLGSLSPGKSMRATPRTLRLPISAIYDAEDTSVDVSRVFVRREALGRITGIEEEYQEIRVRLADPEARDAWKARFVRRYPEFQTETWEDQRRQYLRAVNNEKVMLVIVLSFIVLLGGFIILATLTLTVVEKTKDIGVLSALGASPQGILSIFLGNGFLIGVIGSLIGLGLGGLFVANVNAIKSGLESIGVQIFPHDIYLFREIPTVWSWGNVLWIVGGSIAVAFLAGLLPALRAARMDPVRALRYE